MKFRIKLIFLAAAVTVVAACGGNNSDNKGKAGSPTLPFPDVQVPAMVNNREQAVEYMALNYWKGFTDPSRTGRCDSLYVAGVDYGTVEQKFADWTYILDNVSLDVALKSVSNLYGRILACEKADTSSNVFESMVSITEKYFYNPNSPLRNEEYYLPFVSRYASYEGLSDVERKKFERDARLCSLNRIGTKAADFRFCDRKGTISNMHDIEAELTLMFFSNPGCNACMDIINALNNDPLISSLIDNGIMKVLNIYIDEDLQAWRSYMPIYPENWYNGFDPDYIIRNGDIYSIRAIPSLYLLDKEKNVLMKDVPENVLFNYLNSAFGTGRE